MKTCYVDTKHRAIADLCEYHRGYLLTRINTPREHRGKGVARALLARILADADREEVPLYLEISPSDGLSYEELEAWYLRHGFVYWGGVYRRLPKRAKRGAC